MSHVSGWLLIRLLQGLEFIATQWVFTTVSWANRVWLFLVGLLPRWLFALLSFGW